MFDLSVKWTCYNCGHPNTKHLGKKQLNGASISVSGNTEAYYGTECSDCKFQIQIKFGQSQAPTKLDTSTKYGVGTTYEVRN